MNQALDAPAMAQFRAALLADPSHVPARHHLAVALRRTGQLEKAEAEFMRLMEMDPLKPLPYYYIGSLMLDRGEYEKARDLLTTSVELDPEFEAMRRNRFRQAILR